MIRNKKNAKNSIVCIVLKPLVFLLIIVVFILSIPLLIPLLVLKFFNPKMSNDVSTFLVYNFIWRLFIVWFKLSVDVDFTPIVLKTKLNIVILNHLTSVDMVAIFTLLGANAKYIKPTYKESLKYYLVMGQVGWLINSCTIKRSFEKDRISLTKKLNFFADNKIPASIVIYPEGSRKTTTLLKQSIEYCKNLGIREFKQVLCPRYKLFEILVRGLQAQMVQSSVIDVLLEFDKVPAFIDIIFGTQRYFLSINYKIYSIRDIENPKEWLFKRFREKDEYLSKLK